MSAATRAQVQGYLSLAVLNDTGKKFDCLLKARDETFRVQFLAGSVMCKVSAFASISHDSKVSQLTATRKERNCGQNKNKNNKNSSTA
ncbi:hypothetical protein BaRGS_00034781 [Batillaria attramentaria]|uniref:Uncharacterized protein n=1 Tax=Batillaria attramentaria TaxID=370345 RepID=A0ABD0JGE0_9CAEN